jgi:hypothetical protein
MKIPWNLFFSDQNMQEKMDKSLHATQKPFLISMVCSTLVFLCAL